MQNKANLMVSQMIVSYVKTKNYEQKTMTNEPIKQTQSKPKRKDEVRIFYPHLGRIGETILPNSILEMVKTSLNLFASLALDN
jgi:hypothetical protein